MSDDTTQFETIEGKFIVRGDSGGISVCLNGVMWIMFPPDYQYVINMFLAGGMWRAHRLNVTVDIVDGGCWMGTHDPIMGGRVKTVELTPKGRDQFIAYLREAKAASNVE